MAIPAETIFLDPTYNGTLQQQLQTRISSAILSGRFLPGERLPSSRKLAAHLGISRMTVTLAYTDLLSNDYLMSRGRSGYFVSESAPTAPSFTPNEKSDLPQVDWSRALGQKFSTYTSLARPRNWHEYKYPFIYGQPDSRLFDHQNWRLCALQALGHRDFNAMTSDYYDHDDPMLIEYITRHILPRRGIVAKPEEVLLTLGAQNALWISAQLLSTQRRTVAIENPCYNGMREVLAQTRCNSFFVDVDENGLPPDKLPPDVDVVFTTASHHCPTNVTMPTSRRKELLDRANKDEFIIVEDDYEFEMSFLNSPSPALKSLDQAGSVVYIGSFSKSLFPGLRLGYIVASEPFIEEARALRSLILRHPPGHIQRTAAYFLSLGHYDAQINRMRQAYARRRDTMDAAIKDNNLTTAGRKNTGGSSFWMKAPDGIDTNKLASDLRAKGVVIEPGSIFFDPESNENSFYRLAYSSLPKARIPEGIRLIAEEISLSGPK